MFEASRRITPYTSFILSWFEVNVLLFKNSGTVSMSISKEHYIPRPWSVAWKSQQQQQQQNENKQANDIHPFWR